MTIRERKAYLKTLIENERDKSVLDLVERMLERKKIGLDMKKPIVRRALRAEQDLQEGRFSTLEEFNKEMDFFIEGLYGKKSKTSRSA